jgi:hypothetical protein
VFGVSAAQVVEAQGISFLNAWEMRATRFFRTKFMVAVGLGGRKVRENRAQIGLGVFHKPGILGPGTRSLSPGMTIFRRALGLVSAVAGDFVGHTMDGNDAEGGRARPLKRPRLERVTDWRRL